MKGDGGGSQGSNCSSVNTTSSSSSLSVPTSASKVKAYLYWVGLEQHGGRAYPTVQPLSTTVSFTPAGKSVRSVTASRRMVAGGTYNGGHIQHAGYVADVTSEIDTMSGTYTNTSDPNFPDFGANFANESVNGSAATANGQAIDIDTLTGELAPQSTLMDVDMAHHD